MTEPDGRNFVALTPGVPRDALGRPNNEEGESMTDEKKQPGEWKPDTPPADGTKPVGPKGDLPADDGPPPGKE